MDVKQLIINSIFSYPTLYKDVDFEKSRDKVLNHLFFTNGNGFEWVNGGLECFEVLNTICTLPENYFNTVIMSNEADEDPFDKELRNEFNPNSKFKPYELCAKESLTIYPICKYAKIVNIPEDIQLDWLLAAEDACYLAMDYFTDPYKHCRDMYIQEWMKQRKYDKIKNYLKEQLAFVSSGIVELSKIKNGRYN